MRTLHWTIRCDSCNNTSSMVADNYEDPIVPAGWLRDGDVDTCHNCQLQTVIKRMEPPNDS